MHGLSHHERFALASSGYVIRRQMLAKSEANALGECAEDVFDGRDRYEDCQIYHRNSLFRPGLLLDERLMRLIVHPTVSAIADELCGPDAELTEASLLIDSPDTPPNELHSATNYDRSFPKEFGLTPGGKLRVAYTTMFIYLCDVRRGDGGLILLPGSHHLPPPAYAAIHAETGGDIDRSYFGASSERRERAPCGFLEVEAEAGDFVVMSERIVHGSLGWTPTDRRRVVAILKFVPAGWGAAFSGRFAGVPGPLPPAITQRFGKEAPRVRHTDARG